MTQAMEVEQLVRELNHPRNQSSPDVIDAIQKRIQRLQRESSAWQWGLDLLNHAEAVMRFYGALTLTIKINADWDSDRVGEDRALVDHLLENLITSYIRLSSIPDVPYVLQKLCTTLVAVFQKPQSAWALPIRHLAACLVANRYIPQDTVPDLSISLGSDTTVSGSQLKWLLMFPMTLAEQDAALSGAVREQNVRVRISNNTTDILTLIHFVSTILHNAEGQNVLGDSHRYRLSVECSESQRAEVAVTMLKLLPLWTNDIKIGGSKKAATPLSSKFALFEATVAVVPQLFQIVSLAPAVLQAVTSLEESSHTLLQRALPGYEAHIIRSPYAASWIESLISGDFDPDAVTYVNYLEACMSQADVTSPDYLSTGVYIEMLRQVRSLLQCDGAPGVDDTVCQVALEILTSVTEGFSDWPSSSPYDQSMKDLVKDSCNATLNKIRIPQEELSTQTQTWDADDRAKFQDFRYDVQDYLQNAFSILGDALIEEIVQTVVESDSSSQWDIFEAGLFSLISFSDTLANEPETYDRYLKAIFECEKWQSAVYEKTNIPDRVRQIMIKMIGENTGFLQRQTDFLVPALNFLFTSLHMQSVATAASRAIFTLCDAQRSMLTDALPEFLNTLNSTLDIETDAKHRIYGAVGAIIQALSTEDSKVQPLAQILQRLTEQEVQNEVEQGANQNDIILKAVDILETIASLGRGLRAPSDLPVDLEKSDDLNSQFWTHGPGNLVQKKVLQIHDILQQQTRGESNTLFTEAACDLLRAGFTEEHPSPLKFSNTMVITLLLVYIHPNTPQPDHVLSTASSYLASVKPTDPDNQFSMLFMTVTRMMNDVYTAHRNQSSALNVDFCTAALDFYTRLIPRWASLLLQMPEARDAVGLVIEIALILIEDADTLPRRTSASFLAALLDATGQPAITTNDEASSNMNIILENYAARIIASTIRLLGGVCARSDIDTLTETLKKAIQKQPLMTNQLVKEALKDENAVLAPKALQATKPEQRARFASQIEMLRGQRKTNDVIREFWIACKGREFEYVT